MSSRVLLPNTPAMSQSATFLARAYRTGAVDINGLNPSDRKRIREVGFEQWLTEVRSGKKQVEAQQPAIQQQAKSKLKPGSVGDTLATEFFRVARAHNNIVTYEQVAHMCPAYPTDPASWAREAGATVKTDRKNKRYLVEKYV